MSIIVLQVTVEIPRGNMVLFSLDKLSRSSLTLSAPTPQNGQTHSNNSSPIC